MHLLFKEASPDEGAGSKWQRKSDTKISWNYKQNTESCDNTNATQSNRYIVKNVLHTI